MGTIYNKIVADSSFDFGTYMPTLSSRFTLGDEYGQKHYFVLDNKIPIWIQISPGILGYNDRFGNLVSLHTGQWRSKMALETFVSKNLIWFRASYNDPAITDSFSMWFLANDDGNYYVSSQGDNGLYSASFSNYDTGALQNKIIRAMPVSAAPGSVGYFPGTIVSNNGSTCFTLADTLSSTTVPLYSTISLPDRENYLAIGTNTLARIDEVIP